METRPAPARADVHRSCGVSPSNLHRGCLYSDQALFNGSDLAAGIELLLRAIQTGNLLGNTGDYLLFRISGGRLGQHEEHG